MSGIAVAAPVTLSFTYANGAATAVGSITLETTLLNNPGTNLLVLPSPAVLALSVTVSGASAGNGTFGIADFVRVDFDTSGATLDFTQNLVGQSTPGETWGPAGERISILFHWQCRRPRRKTHSISVPTMDWLRA